MKLTFATSNLHKLAEAKAILKLDIVQSSIVLPEIQGSRDAIIRHKAAYASRVLGKTVFVEDTSLCFSALKGLPGPYINDFLAIGKKKLSMLLDGFSDKRAKAVCSIGFANKGKLPVIFEGITYGKIVAPRGRGWGWDPIFIPRGSKLTYAQLGADGKNKRSFRRKALEKLKDYLLERQTRL